MKKLIHITKEYQTNSTGTQRPIDLDPELDAVFESQDNQHYTWEIEHMQQSTVINPTNGKIIVTTTLLVDGRRQTGTVI